MPGKYSHSAVLVSYSHRGLIDLPNDQRVEYLKSCYPYETFRISTATSRAHSNATKISSTQSATSSTKQRNITLQLSASVSDPMSTAHSNRNSRFTPEKSNSKTGQLNRLKDPVHHVEVAVESSPFIRYQRASRRLERPTSNSTTDIRSEPRSSLGSTQTHMPRFVSSQGSPPKTDRVAKSNKRLSVTSKEGEMKSRSAKLPSKEIDGSNYFLEQGNGVVSQNEKTPQSERSFDKSRDVLRPQSPSLALQPVAKRSNKIPPNALQDDLHRELTVQREAQGGTDLALTEQSQDSDLNHADVDFEGLSDNGESRNMVASTIIHPSSTSQSWTGLKALRDSEMSPTDVDTSYAAPDVSTVDFAQPPVKMIEPGGPRTHQYSRNDSFSSLNSLSLMGIPSIGPIMPPISNARNGKPRVRRQIQDGSFSPRLFEAVLGTSLRRDSTPVEPCAFSSGRDQVGESQSVSDLSAAFPPNIAKFKVREVGTPFTQVERLLQDLENANKATVENTKDAEMKLMELKAITAKNDNASDLAKGEKFASLGRKPRNKLHKRFRGEM